MPGVLSGTGPRPAWFNPQPMTRPRAIAIFTAIAAVAALVPVLQPRPGPEPASAVPLHVPPRKPAPLPNQPVTKRVITPPAAEDPGPADPSPAARVHAALAERLGYVAVRCWVGEEFSSAQYAPRSFMQRVDEGW